MRDTKKIKFLGFNPDETEPLKETIGAAKKETIPPKNDIALTMNVTPFRHKIEIGPKGIFRVMPNGEKIEITDEKTKKLIMERFKTKNNDLEK